MRSGLGRLLSSKQQERGARREGIPFVGGRGPAVGKPFLGRHVGEAPFVVPSPGARTSPGSSKQASRFRGLNQRLLHPRSTVEATVPVQNELSPALTRTLNELRTIQYLEETVGPAGLRRLADSLPDDQQRAMVQTLRRRAASASLELESILEDWTAHLTEAPRKPKPLAPGGLDTAEMVESFVEVKRASAELLRRAARDAPTQELKERLLGLAQEEEAAAAKLQELSKQLAASG